MLTERYYSDWLYDKHRSIKFGHIFEHKGMPKMGEDVCCPFIQFYKYIQILHFLSASNIIFRDTDV